MKFYSNMYFNQPSAAIITFTSGNLCTISGLKVGCLKSNSITSTGHFIISLFRDILLRIKFNKSPLFTSESKSDLENDCKFKINKHNFYLQVDSIKNTTKCNDLLK